MMSNAQAHSVCSNKNYWVLGASSGIGLQLATDLARLENHVIVSGRNATGLEQLKKQYPNHVTVLVFDLQSEDDFLIVKKTLPELIDSLDGVIYCAGICEYVDDLHNNRALYRRVFTVNFFAAVDILELSIPLLKKSDTRGCFMGIGSLAAQAPFTRAQAYGASKAAFEYFMACQRIDLEPIGIDVCTVLPGFVKTPLTDKNDFKMPFLMSVDEASQIIIDGLAKRKKRIIFPKKLYWLLQIYRWWPQLWFGSVAKKMRRENDV